MVFCPSQTCRRFLCVSTFELCSPCLWKLLGRLSTPHASAETSISATIATSLLLKSKQPRSSGLQLLTTFLLIAKSTPKQVITTLNHLGMCLSYQHGWRRLKQIAEDEGQVQRLVQQPILWVYDNLNIPAGLCHERSGE